MPILMLFSYDFTISFTKNDTIMHKISNSIGFLEDLDFDNMIVGSYLIISDFVLLE